MSKKKKGKIKVRSGIYIIINHNNNKIYVGRAVNLDKREREHFGSLENGKHFSRHLQRSFNYYEGKNFEFKILEYCEKEEIRSREAYYIYYYQSYNPLCGYNKTPGGERYVLSDEVKAKISKANKGRKHTEESRKHMSDAHKRKPNGRKGLPMTEKQRKHMEKMRACKKIISPKKGNFKYINHKEEWKILYFNQGYSIQEICIKYNVSDTAVQNILKSLDIDMDNGKELRKKRRIEKLKLAGQKYTELADDIVADYKITLSFMATAENFNTTHHTVARYVREEEKRIGYKIIPKKEVHYRRRKYTELLPIWIEMYNSGISSKKIGDQYDVTPSVVRGVLKKEGVVMRKSTDLSYYKQTKYVNFVDKWIELKSQGMAHNTIAKLYSTNDNTIDGRTVQRYLENFQKV